MTESKVGSYTGGHNANTKKNNHMQTQKRTTMKNQNRSGTNVNHHQTMGREQEPTLHLHLFRNYAPLKISHENRVRSVTFVPSRIFS